MALLAIIYLLLFGARAIVLIQEPLWIAKLAGVLMLAFPLVGAWSIYKEIQFGFNAQELASRAVREGVQELLFSYRPSGKPTKESAKVAFDQVSMKADLSSWQDNYLLAQAYEANGDRRRARLHLRRAISLANNAKSSQP